MKRLLEVRFYNLKPGMLDEFDRLVVEQSVPMLLRWGVDLVAYGASPHDPDSYFLMRAYADDAERQASQDAFYGSSDWRAARANDPELHRERRDQLAGLDPATIDGLRPLRDRASD